MAIQTRRNRVQSSGSEPRFKLDALKLAVRRALLGGAAVAAGFGATPAQAIEDVHGSVIQFAGLPNGNGVTFGDLDSDGQLDAVVGDKSGNVTFYKNIGGGLFLPRDGVADPFRDVSPSLPGSLNAAPVLADLDGDGDLDLVVGSKSGLRYLENVGAPHAPRFVERTGTGNPFDGLSLPAAAPAVADLDGDGDLDLVVVSKSGPSAVVLYLENIGSATAPAFTLHSGSSNPFDGVLSALNTPPALADLDGDGDIDAVINDSTSSSFDYLQNVGNATAPAFSALSGSDNPFLGVPSYGALVLADLDGDGDFDGAIVNTYEAPRLLNNSGSATAPAFSESSTPLSPFSGTQFSVGNAAPALGDLDGDGRLDAVVGSSDGAFLWYRNTGSPQLPAFTVISASATDNPFPGISVGANSTPALADLDGDGDLDVVAGTGDGSVHFLRNTGSASAPAFIEVTGTDNPFDGIDVGTNSTPALADLDGDGDLDALIGSGSGKFSTGALRYFQNIGTRTAPVFSELSGSANPFDGISVSGGAAPAFVDIDGDGDLDLAVGGKSAALYRQVGPLQFRAVTANQNPLSRLSSLNVRPAFGDLDGDGDPDLVFGSGSGGGLSTFYNVTARVESASGSSKGFLGIGAFDGLTLWLAGLPWLARRLRRRAAGAAAS